jgi:predicted ATP-grasp superfamily ATP-dependent carboligase
MSAYNVAQGVYGHEAVNELLAYRIAAELSIPVPETKLIKALVCIDNTEFETYIAVSESFKSECETRMSYENFYKSVRLKNESAMSVAIRFGWEATVQQMVLFDFLIFNRDRHGANLEVLENNGIRRLSPLFDNGLSLAVSCHTDAELDAFDVTADNMVNNFIGSRSLYENIKDIPASAIICRPRSDFYNRLFSGLNDVLSAKHRDVIWELFSKRWEYILQHILEKQYQQV